MFVDVCDEVFGSFHCSGVGLLSAESNNQTECHSQYVSAVQRCSLQDWGSVKKMPYCVPNLKALNIIIPIFP